MKDAIWHLCPDEKPIGPYTRSQVMQWLNDGSLSSSDLIWRRGMLDWEPISKCAEFQSEPESVSPIYDNQRQLAQTHMNNSRQGNRNRGVVQPSLLYRASPVMFRANPIAFVFAMLLTPVVVGIVILVIWAIIARTTYLEIDEETVRFETGVFSKDRRALSRRAIRTVRVTQTLLNRMLDVGTIEIFTAGDVPEIRAMSMYEPNEIRELLGK